MKTLNNAELAFLAVIGYPELTVKVLRVYANQIYLFTDVFHPHLNMMWNRYMSVLGKYKKEYGFKPSKDLVAAELMECIQADGKLPSELKDKCDSILQKYATGSIPSVDEGSRLVKMLMQLDANRKMVAKLNANADLQTLQQSLDAAKRTMDSIDDTEEQEETVSAIVHPLRDIRKLATKVDRIPTGVNWLDDISSGGGRATDKWLILGPPGGGKTICAVQFACAQAMLGNTVLWATYEQSVEGDIAERIIANITDTSLSQIRDVGFDNLDEDIIRKYMAATAGVDDLIVTMDMPGRQPDPQDPDDYGGIQSIWNEYKKMKADGKAPRIVLIDWFGSMMSHIAANLHVDLAQCYRFKAQEEINKLIRFAKTEKVHIIVFHQLDVKAAGARPTYLANATQSQDMHNLQNYFDLVGILGVRDKNDILYISNPKSRKGGRVVRTLHMIGDKAKLLMEDGWVPNKDGNFYCPGKVEPGTYSTEAQDAFVRELE